MAAAIASYSFAFAIVLNAVHGIETYSLTEPVTYTEKRITCSCGKNAKNPVFVYTPINALEKDICTKYSRCKSCAVGLERCLTCLPYKYGQWCEMDCECLNGGACAANGTCICQNGFKGKACEVEHIKLRRRNLRRRREDKDSVVGCEVFPPPANGNHFLENDKPKVGDAIKYTCKENFTMMGSRTRHCNGNGKWSGEAPTCEKMCSFPSTTQHVEVKINPYLLGSPLFDSFGSEVLAELEFSCSPGYTLVGPQRVRCASGIWDQDIPFCRLSAGCDDPGAPENGYKNVTNAFIATYQPGNQITYECNSKHALVGSPKITCLPTGLWSSSVPTCIPDAFPMCVFTCKSQETQDKLRHIDTSLVCRTKGIENLQNGDIVLVPEQ